MAVMQISKKSEEFLLAFLLNQQIRNYILIEH